MRSFVSKRFAVAFWAALQLGLSVNFVPSLAIAGAPTGALKSFAKSRTWADASGKHKIQGALKFADAQNVQITQSNGKVMKIKLSGLSAADRSFVKEFLEAERSAPVSEESENPFIVSDDESEAPSMDESSGSSGLSFEAAEESSSSDTESSDAQEGKANEPTRRKSIVQNVKRFTGKFDKAFWSVKPLKGFPEVNFEEFGVSTSLIKPFFASFDLKTAGTAGVSVIGVYQQGKFDADFSRFNVLFGKDGSVSETIELASPWKLQAISPDGKRVAMIRVEGFDRGNDIGIFNVTKTGLVPDFQFTAGGGSFDEIDFVEFAAGNRLVTISRKHTVGVWDLGNEKGVKAIYVGNSGQASEAAFSPAREVMAMPAGNNVAIIDVAGAKLAGLIERKSKATKLSFSPDGQRLAAYEPFETVVYNMANGEIDKVVTVSSPAADAPLFWLGKYLMVGNVVYDIERNLPLWTYESDNAVRSVLGSYLFTAFPSDKGSSLSVIKLPHDRALADSASIDPSAIYAVVPGDAVSVTYNLRTTPSDKQSAIKEAVERKIAAIGWRVDPASNLRVVIDVEQGQQGSVDYYTSQSRSPFIPTPAFGRPTGPKETVTYTPWTQKFQVYTGDKLEYEVVMGIGAPSGFTVNDGESTQAAVNRICQPSAAYFEGLGVAPKLLKKEYQGGLGKSKITPDGLQ